MNGSQGGTRLPLPEAQHQRLAGNLAVVLRTLRYVESVTGAAYGPGSHVTTRIGHALSAVLGGISGLEQHYRKERGWARATPYGAVGQPVTTRTAPATAPGPAPGSVQAVGAAPQGQGG